VPVPCADPHQLQQVLVNLLTNAHHAMRRQERPRRLSLTVRHDAVAGRVCLAIADSGAGIPREIQQKIFEAFFTTKAQGEGTGLGLSLCRSIVEEHGGVLTVESTVGVGTTFRIELPVVAPPAKTAQASAEAGLPAVGPRRILVVDDEPTIAAVLADSLERDGHTARV